MPGESGVKDWRLDEPEPDGDPRIDDDPEEDLEPGTEFFSELRIILKSIALTKLHPLS